MHIPRLHNVLDSPLTDETQDQFEFHTMEVTGCLSHG